MRLGVSVVLLAQLSREPEKRDGGRPQLSDLRDSGAIEQDADAAILIDRRAGTLAGKLLVAKHRNGPTGEIDVFFDGGTFRFTEVELEKSSQDDNPFATPRPKKPVPKPQLLRLVPEPLEPPGKEFRL